MVLARPLPAQAVREDVGEEAAYQALRSLESYIHARSAGLRNGWIFGPNLDDCYFYRTRYNDTSEFLTGDGTSAQKEFAVSHGVPDLDSIPAGERLAMQIANYEGRRGAMDDTRQFLCIKHIPGGTRFLENTEHIRSPLVYTEPLQEWQPFLVPFQTVLQAPDPLPAMMTSHACYPALEAAMREAYPDIQTWIPEDMDCPATFSPWILRGLVRRQMGYDGPVVTDWVDMGAVNRFLLDNRRRMPARYDGLSKEAVIVVLAVEAGSHVVTGIQNRLLRISRPVNVQPLIDELASYRKRDSSWQRTVDGRFRELVAWFVDPPFSIGGSVESAMGISFQDKLRLVIGEQVADTKAAWLNVLSTKGFQDLWNRQGLLHSQLRAFYINARFEMNTPELPYRSDDERVVTIDKNIDWLDGLFGDAVYTKAYKSVAWESGQSSAAWQKALERFKKEQGYTDQ